MLIKIPVELKPAFDRDPENFIRDIACIPLEALRPFFRRKAKISSAVSSERVNPFDPVTLTFDPNFLCHDKFRRYMHIDLAVNRDAVGISMCHAPHFVKGKKVAVVNGKEIYEEVSLPYLYYDFIGRISAAKGEEIILGDIREVIYELSRRHFWISVVTFDRFNSVDSIQILKDAGYVATNLSLDRTAHKIVLDRNEKEGFRKESTNGQYTASYAAFKEALYGDRISIPNTVGLASKEHWVTEAKAAEYNAKKNKVDHPPGGSIDLLQSIVGSAYNLTNNEFEYEEMSEKEIKAAEDPFYSNFVEPTLTREDESNPSGVDPFYDRY